MALTIQQRALLEQTTPWGVRLKLASYSLGSDDVGFSPTMRIARADIEQWLVRKGREQEKKTVTLRQRSLLSSWIGL